jgi:hypothetical protein
MAKPPTFPPAPEGEVRFETPDGIVWSRGDETYSNVYENNNNPFRLPLGMVRVDTKRQKD